MKLTYAIYAAVAAMLLTGCSAPKQLTENVNPLLGTATLWDAADLGYERTLKSRTWGAEVFPGAALPCAMVQLTPITMWGSGAGYQYEDNTILGFAHTAMGHWNYLDLPVLPVCGQVTAEDYASPFSHDNEEAHPGYYRAYLQRYGVDAELSSTLRTGCHRYTFRPADAKRLLVNIAHNQHPISDWQIEKAGENAFRGRQRNDIFFFAVTSLPIDSIAIVGGKTPVAIVDFLNNRGKEPLEIKIGISSVSCENARINLEAESLNKSFDRIRAEANGTWLELLGKMKVKGGSERQRRLFYSTLYRASLMPRLQSDVNGQYRDERGRVTDGSGYRYYANPPFWDVYRNQLILLGMLQPDVASDVICSTIERGEKSGGYIPTYFHGDHAPTFVMGCYKRGIRNFDLDRAYRLALKSATVPGKRGRKYLDEYMVNGYIADVNLPDCPFYEEHKGGVTKTLEYAYDDYAVAQMARELGDSANYHLLMTRSQNYRNVFDPSTGFFRGRVEGGTWMTPYSPDAPYFQHMYREANGWNSLFYAPHDPEGMLSLYPSEKAVENKLDSMLVRPWCGLEVHNMTGFIGNYCHGNQPGHNIPYTYSLIGKPEKTQALIDSILDRFYDMGAEGLAYAGMDDGGEMSAWYVLNAAGIYTYSPADPEYFVTVPLFDRIDIELCGRPVSIQRKGRGRKISRISCGGSAVEGFFISHDQLLHGKNLIVETSE